MILGRQVVDLDMVRRGWVCLVVFVLLVALGRLLAGGAMGAGRRSVPWHSCILARGILARGILARGILARGILALGWLAQYMRIGGIRIQLTAGGWGWRGLADGCCC